MFWAVTVAGALPFLLTPYPPFADLPEHIVSISVIAKMLSGHGSSSYDFAFGQSQYVLVHVAGALLTIVMRGDAILAHRVLLTLIAMAWPIAFRSVLRAAGRDERLALFVPLTFFNRALLMGFIPFLASVPLGFALLAQTFRVCRLREDDAAPAPATTRLSLAGILVTALALFYTHVSSFLLFGAIAVACLVGSVFTRKLSPRRALAALSSLVPSLVAALYWYRAGSLGSRDQVDSRMSARDAVFAMPAWAFDIWRSHVDEICAVIWWTAFLVLLVSQLRSPVRPSRAKWLLPLPFACACAAYLVTPFRVGVASMLNVRLAPVLVLLGLLPLGIVISAKRARLVLGSVAAATGLMSAWSTYEMRMTSREILGDDFDALLATARPNGRLVTLAFERNTPALESRRTKYWPYMFAGSYYVARGGAIAAFGFAELPHWPVHYKPEHAPRKPHAFWAFDPCSYRYEEDGAYYDYVLVQGERDPFANVPPGPSFVKVARSGMFTLYERAAGPPRALGALDVDAGPCGAPEAISSR